MVYDSLEVARRMARILERRVVDSYWRSDSATGESATTGTSISVLLPSFTPEGYRELQGFMERGTVLQQEREWWESFRYYATSDAVPKGSILCVGAVVGLVGLDGCYMMPRYVLMNPLDVSLYPNLIDGKRDLWEWRSECIEREA